MRFDYGVLVMAIKLVTSTDKVDEIRMGQIERGLETVRGLVADGTIDGLCMIVIMKGGTNWTQVTAIADNLKMIGAIEFLKAETIRAYQEAYQERE